MLNIQEKNISPLSFGLAILSFLLYANTFGHDYTQDDAIVIYDNMYTTAGISGLKGLFTKDTFHGFFKEEGKDKLVKGGRYRPLTPIMFAVEYQFFGANPVVGHIINALLYALLVVLLFKSLMQLWYRSGDPQWHLYCIVVATVLFAVHPIHTEAVANIKGRDEIMALVCSLGALSLAISYVDKGGYGRLVLAAVVFFLGLLSKENTITYLAIVPASLYLARDRKWLTIWRPTLALLLSTILFLALRTYVLGLDFGGETFELMNNPFLKIEGGQYVPLTFAEKYATIIFTLGMYLKLLVFPHPLTHDYYPRHIDIMSFGDLQVLLAVALHIGLILIATRSWRKAPILAWSILYYFATLSIVSNVVFPIGTNMSERFVFMPSVGFCMLVAYAGVKVGRQYNKTLAKVVLAVVVLALSAKTIVRNQVWQDDFTLFTTDVKTSSRSAKVLNAAGGAMSTKAATMDDGPERSELLAQATSYLEQAMEVHPNYANPALLLGNVNYYRGDYEGAIQAYERAIDLNPGFRDAAKNLAIAYRDAGRQAGERDNDIDKAIRYLLQSHNLSPSDLETTRLLGVAYGVAGNHAEAAKYFEIVYAVEPENKAILQNLLQAHLAAGNLDRVAEIQGSAQN